MAKNTSKGSGDKKNVWKGIQKRLSTAATKKPQDGEQVSTHTKTEDSRSKTSSITSLDDFKDAENDTVEDDEDDDYFQNEDLEEKQKKSPEEKQTEEIRDSLEETKVEGTLKNSARPLSEMAFILPALQNHGYDSDEDDNDNESLKDPREIQEEEKPFEENEKEEVTKSVEPQAIQPAAAPILPVELKPVSSEKPTTYEPIPDEKEATKEIPTKKLHEVHAIYTPMLVPEHKQDSTQEDAEAVTSVPEIKDSDLSPVKQPVTDTPKADPDSGIPDNGTIDSEVVDSGVSSSSPPVEKQTNRLANILPAVEESFKHITSASDLKKSLEEQLPARDKERASRSREFEYSIEDPIDLDLFRDNVIAIQSIDPKDIPVNDLKPRQQEEAGKEGMKYLFDNRFMKAKSIFETRSTVDPLYALGLGAMAFIKAIMTFHEFDRETAMSALATAYTIAKAQIDNTSFKKPFKDTVTQYFTSILSHNNTGLPANPSASTMPNSSGGISDPSSFMPNGVLRAHVVKAECCLLMGILQMTQESVIGYLKCGLNIRRAYHSYGIVWREYKRMGQEYTKYMDCDTVSAIQFGIGSVHLILSSMPPKILKIFSLLGWKSDKQLGFALLKLCLEGGGIRAPLASLMLLAYYSVLTSFAPQLYTKDMMSPAIECLLDAQGKHPNSCFFLFFAARISRVAKNLPLSIQSFTFAAESSKGEWTEVAMKQLSDYEIGFNLALQLDWKAAATYFEQLSQEKYWSPAFSKYFVGACFEMNGQRTEAILAFAQVPESAKDQNKKSYIDAYVEKKVEFFQKSGYQDLDFSLPGIEIFLVLNAFEYMEKESLEACLEKVERALEMIYEREKIEYTIRLRELVPASAPPDYYDQRCVLLLSKASILNSLGRYDETIPHLNWVLDHRDCITHETWVVPFAYWESGVTSWGLNNYVKSRKLWQLAMACTKYDFEYRMAVRLSLALSKCDDIGVTHIDDKELKGESTNSRKRMPILSISPQVV
ncbi:hypothetical protein G6F37_000654 [Rhizopus arrhizus]|nr:hypothetical protein G6F38_000109 [Rhizopus arrhizus]KAG1164053.1 hypothetical protein G6F37_000654 [Rhizopus arrhizus]